MTTETCYTLDSNEVQYLCEQDKQLARGIQLIAEVGSAAFTDSFAFIIRTIIGQMLSTKAAEAIESRFNALCTEVTPESVRALSIEQLRGNRSFAEQVEVHFGFCRVL